MLKFITGKPGGGKTYHMMSAVVAVPPVDREELKAALSQVTTDGGRCTLVGSFVWISDTLESVRKIVADIEEIRTRSERSYLAEVYFVRVNEKDFVQLTGDLKIKSVDVFSSAFNIEELFQMFLDADAGLGSSSVDARPVLTLSEGRKAVFEVGSEIVRERKAVNERGIMETTGYEKFADGIDLTLMLNRVSDERYSLDLSLSVSTFDRSEKNDTGIPIKNKSVLKSPGLLVRDGGVVYAGSLKRKDGNKVFGLFSIDGLRSSDVLTIWVRVREVR
jgi:Flp pilus assembly secretin CpaC